MSNTTVVRAKLGNTRRTGKEQFYTPSSTARRLIEVVEQRIPDFASRSFLEPAGGSGAFVIELLARGLSVLSFDIEPHHPAVRLGSFLDQKLGQNQLVTISNPPFGRNNSLSIPFFNHAAQFSDYICFIVPRSWRKWSVINRLDRNFELIHDQDLQLDYVDRQGDPLSNKLQLNTCFQIWSKGSALRPLLRVRDFGIVTKTDASSADVALSVFGYRCGQVETEFVRAANSTKLFLKLSHPEALTALKSVDFSRFFRNTAYTEALSMMEINFLLNEFIFGEPYLEEIT